MCGYGVIDSTLPLIQNLNMIENVELVLKYHYIKNIDLNSICSDFSDKREPDISTIERFGVMFIRAMVYSRKILIIRPLLILDDVSRLRELSGIFERFDDYYDEILIYELDRYENIYEGILDEKR